MVRLIESIIINAPLDKVFEYLGNPRNMLEWHPNITRIRDIIGHGENMRWNWEYKMMGINFSGKAQVMTSVIQTMLQIDNTGEIESIWTFTFKPEADGTRLDFQIDYTIPKPVLDRVSELLIIQRNERVAAMAMANIKEIMEG